MYNLDYNVDMVIMTDAGLGVVVGGGYSSVISENNSKIFQEDLSY